MIYFNNDYSEGCHQKVLDALIRTNLEQTPGYGALCAPLPAISMFMRPALWRQPATRFWPCLPMTAR